MDMALGFLEWIVYPILDLGARILLSPIVWLWTEIVNFIMSWVCSLFTDRFIIGESMLNDTFYKALTSGNIYNNMRAVAFSAMVIIAVWQIFKTFFSVMGLSGELEEPWKIALKLILFGILIVYSKEICEMMIKPAGYILGGILQIEPIIKKGQVTGSTIGKAGYNALISGSFFGVFGSGFLMLVTKFIILIYVNWKLFGFMCNIAQKYFNMIIYVTLAPIAFACGVSRATADILKSWTRLFAGGIAIQGVQFIILKFLEIYVQIMANTVIDWSVLFIYFSLGAILSKLEDILQELGLPGGMKFDIASSVKEVWDIIVSIIKMILAII